MYIVLTGCSAASKFRLPLWKTNTRLAGMKGLGSHYIFLMFIYGFILELSYEMANTFNSGRILLNKMEVGS